MVVTGFGKSIGISKSTLTIKENAKVLQTFPLSTVEHIAIQTNACNISSKLIEYCADNKIPIDFLDFNGQPYAKIFSPLNDTYQLWYLQFEHLQQPTAIAIAKDLVLAKINNQAKLLKYFSKYAKYHETDLPA
ncbi:MAG: CRISPR-associated endonuclease Cas1, partial [Bacteroidetes bacterium]|nr:CRISPR-associated endonuclease Cas1 [Bacteroidota bacterium]